MKHLEAKGFHLYEDGRKWLARGITYGPFRPAEDETPYPDERVLEDDFQLICAAGANLVRVYTEPPRRVVEVAERHGLRILVDVPWPKHLDVYDDRGLQKYCEERIVESMDLLSGIPNLMGVMLGNEVPSDIIRWQGQAKVAKHLRRLYELAKSIQPDLLVGFSNYPSAEFLMLDFFDFLGFNVYLEDPSAMRDYLIRLRHLYPEKPLLLSETGLDTQSASEKEQASALRNSLASAFEVGFAGAVVFSFTDEWHTGGFDINDWSFGVTDGDRNPKPAYNAISRLFQNAPHTWKLTDPPLISVVVATYNGAATLRECLNSLLSQDYPRFEIIVVNDGSTDNTAEILDKFKDVRVVHQENHGLSVARNTGIREAKGEIIAFTDSDCCADRDWLYGMALAFERERFSGFGGPNLTPRESCLMSRCVSYAPGHATHVLLSPEEAEHVPGCNMAFRRQALADIGNFDADFRRAGDDVDIIWRMQERGMHIGFAPGAFVWHHRRSTAKAYIRQQMGYGEAESMLVRKHPHRFNDRGQSLWRGIIYQGRVGLGGLSRPNIHYGVFGTAGYQCIYERPEHYIFHFVTSIEWWWISLALLVIGIFVIEVLFLGVIAVLVSLGVSGAKACQRLQNSRDFSAKSFVFVSVLWVLQPIVRGWARYWSRLKTQTPVWEQSRARRLREVEALEGACKGKTLQLWAEEGCGRIDVLRAFCNTAREEGWLFTPNSGWEPWDLMISISWWMNVRLTTAEEDHGAGKRLLRLRLRLVPTSLFWTAFLTGLFLAVSLLFHDTITARIVLTAVLVASWFAYRQAAYRKRLLAAFFATVAHQLGYMTIGEGRRRESVEATKKNCRQQTDGASVKPEESEVTT